MCIRNDDSFNYQLCYYYYNCCCYYSRDGIAIGFVSKTWGRNAASGQGAVRVLSGCCLVLLRCCRVLFRVLHLLSEVFASMVDA